MKIMQVVHCFPPEPSGGTEQVVTSLVAELAARGHELQIVAGSLRWQNGAGVGQEEWHGFPVTRIRRDDPWFDRWDNGYNPEVEKIFRELLRQAQPDVVHIHHWLRLSRNLVQICAAEGIPAVVQLHDFQATCPRTFRLKEGGEFCRCAASVDGCLQCTERWPFQNDAEIRHQLDHYLRDFNCELRQAHARLTLSQAQTDIMESVIATESGPFTLLPNPAVTVLEREIKTPGGEVLRLAHWGNLYDLKGVSDLLTAVGLAAEETRVHLDIYGEAVEPDYHQELTDAVVGKPVTLHGRYQREELGRIDADLAIFPSRCFETYGLVVDEAFMLGLPVLVTRAGALPERVGTGGLVVEPGNVPELVQAIVRLGQDREELARLTAGVTKCWTSGAEAAAMAEQVYDQVLSGQLKPLPPFNQITEAERLRFYWYITAMRQASLGYSAIEEAPPWRNDQRGDTLE